MFATETIQITTDLLERISEIDEFKGTWRALGAIAPDRLNGLRRVAITESIGSSARHATLTDPMETLRQD